MGAVFVIDLLELKKRRGGSSQRYFVSSPGIKSLREDCVALVFVV